MPARFLLSAAFPNPFNPQTSLTLMLDRVSEFLDEKIDQRIQTLLSLMEPVLLLVMAVVVGGLLLAIYMPLLSSFSSAQM